MFNYFTNRYRVSVIFFRMFKYASFSHGISCLNVPWMFSPKQTLCSGKLGWFEPFILNLFSAKIPNQNRDKPPNIHLFQISFLKSCFIIDQRKHFKEHTERVKHNECESVPELPIRRLVCIQYNNRPCDEPRFWVIIFSCNDRDFNRSHFWQFLLSLL